MKTETISKLLSRLRSKFRNPIEKRSRLRRFMFERMEDRCMLATFAQATTTLNLALAANEQATITSSGTSYSVALTGGTWSGTNSANVTGNGTTSLAVTSAGLAALNLINITDSGSGSDVVFGTSTGNFGDAINITLNNGGNTLTVNGAVTLNANVSITAVVTSTISLPNTTSDISASGTGVIDLRTSQNIALGSGSSIKTVNGNLTLWANWATTTSGNFVGIDVNNAQIQATGTGAVELAGRAGIGGVAVPPVPASGLYGVRIYGGSAVLGGTSNSISVFGTGGDAVVGVQSIANIGVYVEGSNSAISSAGGNVVVSGKGGKGIVGGQSNYGVFVAAAGQIKSTGAGTVFVTGEGGANNGAGNFGVYVNGANSVITSGVSGNVNVDGYGADIGAANHGVIVSASGQITSGGTGAVNITGHGGFGGSSYGVAVTAASTSAVKSIITSGGGNVSVVGNGGGSGTAFDGWGVFVENGQIKSGGTGTVSVNGTGGSGNGNKNFGVYVSHSGLITSGGAGAVGVTGTGGSGTGLNNFGVYLAGFLPEITSGGGSVSVTGFGGNGNESHGVMLVDGNFNSGGGNVSVTGTSNANGDAVYIDSEISCAIGALITVTADSIQIDVFGFIRAGAGTVIVKPRTSGTRINIGGEAVRTGSPLTLGLYDSELDHIIAGTLQVGDASSGSITVSAPVTHNNNLSLRTGAGVTLNDAVTMAADKNFTLSALGTSNGTVNLASTFADILTSGTGAVSITTVRDILLSSESSITTANGNLTLWANWATVTSGNFVGIDINNARIQATGTGTVEVAGRGGIGGVASPPVPASGLYGVRVRDRSAILGGTSNSIRVFGTGGDAVVGALSISNIGVSVEGLNSTISSAGGNVVVSGKGGKGIAGGQNNLGVSVTAQGQIKSAGTGTVFVTGEGGSNNGASNFGVYVDGAFSVITSGASGNVNVDGFGADTGAANHGVTVSASGQIKSGGTGAVNLTGTSGGAGVGVLINSSGQITSGGIGAVSVIGTGGTAGSESIGVKVDSTTGTSMITSGGGNVTVQGTGRGSSTGSSNHGVVVTSSGKINSGSVGTVSISGTSGSGSDCYGVLVSESGQITSGGTGAVGVTGTSAGTTRFNFGVHVLNSGVITSGGGNVTVNGNGSIIAGTSNSNYGVYVSAAEISSSGNGAVVVNGIGGTGGSGHGVLLFESQIRSGSGAGTVSVTGTGGASGSSNRGVVVSSSQIKSGGIGTVSVSGTGGAGSGGNNNGVWVDGNLGDSLITSGGGNVSVAGTGGTGTGGFNYGVYVTGTRGLITSVNGSVSVVGTGGSASGNGNYGIYLSGGGRTITSGGGNVSVTGTGNSTSEAVVLGSGVITAFSGSSIGVAADSISIDSASAINGGTGTVNIKQRTNGTRINLGGVDVLTGSPLTLGLTDAELDRVTAGTIQIGDANSGSITITSPITHTNTNAIVLTAGVGQNINLNSSITTAGGPLTLNSTLVLGAGAALDTTNGGAVPAGAPVNTSQDINLGANTFTWSSGTSSSISNVISGSGGSLVKMGSGTLTLLGNNTYTGATTINGGRLNVNGSTAAGSTVTVNNNGTLGGMGTLNGTVNVASGGTMSPGTRPGVLNTGNIHFNSGSNFAVEINGAAGAGSASGHDQVNVTGSVTINSGTLNVSLGYTPANLTSFRIVNNDSNDPIAITSPFLVGITPITEGQSFFVGGTRLVLSYVGGDGNDVVLTVMNNLAPTALAISNTIINENLPSGTTIGTLSTSDPDVGDAFTYSLVTGAGSVDNGAFTILGNQLKANANFDYETKSSFSIRVRTTDSGGLFFEKDLTINVENVLELAAPVQIGDDTAQRSLIRQLVVDFDSDAIIDDDAFLVQQRTMVGGNLVLSNVAVQISRSNTSTGGSRATLSFTGSLTNGFGAIVDGYYQLTVFGSKIRIRSNGQAFDGNKDGLPGGDYVLGTQEADLFFALYGDADGNGEVGTADVLRAQRAFGKHPGETNWNASYDYDGNLEIGSADLLRVRRAFGKTRGTF